MPAHLQAYAAARVSAGALYVAPVGATLLLDPRYASAWTPRPDTALRPYAHADDFLRALLEVIPGGSRVAVHADTLNYALGKRLEAVGLELVPADTLISGAAAAKTEDEIATLREAARITDRILQDVLSDLRPGVSERTLRAEIDRRLTAEADGPAFGTIVAFGERTALPHAQPGERTLRRGDLVTVDAGATLGGLHADLTYTVAFGPHPVAREWLALTAEALRAAEKVLRAGVSAAELDEAARAPYRAAGLDAFTLRGIGHAVGYELHEAPILREGSAVTVPADTVVTLEPGVYVPGTGGVRLERMLRVTPQGSELLGGPRLEEALA
nr:M24 family metallopeptidase [Deinobacterium chartae]